MQGNEAGRQPYSTADPNQSEVIDAEVTPIGTATGPTIVIDMSEYYEEVQSRRSPSTVGSALRYASLMLCHLTDAMNKLSRQINALYER